MAHPGARTTKHLIASKFVWHGLNKQVTDWAHKCLSCQKSKVQTHTKAPDIKIIPIQKFFPSNNHLSGREIVAIIVIHPSSDKKHLRDVVK